MAQWVRPLNYLATDSNLNDKKGYTRLADASDKVYQLLARGRWLSPSTPAYYFTTKTDRHDITEILLKVSLNTTIINQSKSTKAKRKTKYTTLSEQFQKLIEK